MKRMLLAAIALASTLGVAHAQTYQFGEGQTQPQSDAQPAQPAPLPGATEVAPLPQGAVPEARPASRRHHVTPHRHHYRPAVHKRRHVRHVRHTRHAAYRHT
ncbi:hypothetical protein DID96_04000 [Burkholderia sp. Bp8963]|uniref:hypothetical protein n=1 Tax=Burkholderia sp. Bp8963 TaxID=2184547 RepID=UPI000F5AF699|nr:hypothetical protein [Burkholderia sp. Bp8963]RQS75579.1 hypothetical protein DID96_04000 [Burkholderia sp. Bp8963]